MIPEPSYWVVIERHPHGVSLAAERLYRSREQAETAWQIRKPPRDGRDLVAVPLAYPASGWRPVDTGGAT